MPSPKALALEASTAAGACPCWPRSSAAGRRRWWPSHGPPSTCWHPPWPGASPPTATCIQTAPLPSSGSPRAPASITPCASPSSQTFAPGHRRISTLSMASTRFGAASSGCSEAWPRRTWRLTPHGLRACATQAHHRHRYCAVSQRDLSGPTRYDDIAFANCVGPCLTRIALPRKVKAHHQDFLAGHPRAERWQLAHGLDPRPDTSSLLRVSGVFQQTHVSDRPNLSR